MYRIKTRGNSGSVVAKELVNNFEKAKKVFRDRITEYYSESIKKFVKQIKQYSKKYYVDNMPKELENLINMLVEIVTNPNFSDNVEDYGELTFNDDRVDITAMSTFVGIIAFSKEVKAERLFPEGEIRVFDMNDDDASYYISLTNNRDECLHISLDYTIDDTISEDDDDMEYNLINSYDLDSDEEDEFISDEDNEFGFGGFDDEYDDSEEEEEDYSLSDFEDDDITEIDESDELESSGNKCLSCHYYNSCDDNDSGGLYCPSYRKNSNKI